MKPEELLHGLRPPGAPEALRRRALVAARAAAAEPQAASWIDRLWESRTWRLGWVAAAVALIGGHLALTGSAPATARPPQSAAASPFDASAWATGSSEPRDASVAEDDPVLAPYSMEEL